MLWHDVFLAAIVGHTKPSDSDHPSSRSFILETSRFTSCLYNTRIALGRHAPVWLRHHTPCNLQTATVPLFMDGACTFRGIDPRRWRKCDATRFEAGGGGPCTFQPSLRTTCNSTFLFTAHGSASHLKICLEFFPARLLCLRAS